MEMNTEQTLINAVVLHPILYDYTDKNYHDMDRKDNVWRAVATDFDMSGTCYG